MQKPVSTGKKKAHNYEILCMHAPVAGDKFLFSKNYCPQKKQSHLVPESSLSLPLHNALLTAFKNFIMKNSKHSKVENMNPHVPLPTFNNYLVPSPPSSASCSHSPMKSIKQISGT